MSDEEKKEEIVEENDEILEESSEEIEDSSDELSNKSDSEIKKQTISNLDLNRFQDFVEAVDSSLVLDQIAVASENISKLETDLADVSRENVDNDQIKYSDFKYSGEQKESYEENQVRQNEPVLVGSPKSIARGDLRKDFSAGPRQDFEFNPELKSEGKNQSDDYIVGAPKNNFKEFKTQDPFQKDLKKDYEFR